MTVCELFITLWAVAISALFIISLPMYRETDALCMMNQSSCRSTVHTRWQTQQLHRKCKRRTLMKNALNNIHCYLYYSIMYNHPLLTLNFAYTCYFVIMCDKTAPSFLSKIFSCIYILYYHTQTITTTTHTGIVFYQQQYMVQVARCRLNECIQLYSYIGVQLYLHCS